MEKDRLYRGVCKLLQVLGEIGLEDKCVQALDSTRGGQLVALGGQLNSVKTGVIS